MGDREDGCRLCGSHAVEVDEQPRNLTIVEYSLMPGLSGEPAWLRVPSARLTYTATTRLWTLYCFDGDSRAHRLSA